MNNEGADDDGDRDDHDDNSDDVGDVNLALDAKDGQTDAVDNDGGDSEVIEFDG